MLILASVAGSLAGMVGAMLAGDGIRKLVFWRKRDTAGPGAVSKWLANKGPWAIGLLGPLLIGPLFAAALTATLGLPRRSSFSLLAAGVVLWTCVFTLLGAFGLARLGPGH